ncbi:hypothetical protein ACWDA3_04915 [Nonomuraea rubra]
MTGSSFTGSSLTGSCFTGLCLKRSWCRSLREKLSLSTMTSIRGMW